MAKKSTRKAQWERGYNSHGYWLGRDKLGEVRLSPEVKGEGRYLWQAGNRTGGALTLADAKRLVETLTEQGARQLGLFEE